MLWEVEIVFLPHPDAVRRISRAYALILDFVRAGDDEIETSYSDSSKRIAPRDTLDDPPS